MRQRRVDRGAHIVGQTFAEELTGHADAQAAQRRLQHATVVLAGNIQRGRVPVRIRAAHRAEHQRAVLRAARHRSGLVQAGCESNHPVPRRAAIARLDAGDAAKGGRLADGPAGVGSGGGGEQPGRHRYRAAAGGAAGYVRGIPGVGQCLCRTMADGRYGRVLVSRAHRKFVAVEFA